MKFIADCHLGKIAKYLRIFGFDTLYFQTIDDNDIIKIAKKENRIVLTSDVELYQRLKDTNILYIYHGKFEEQLLEIFNYYNFFDKCVPFTLCIECNGELKNVLKNEVIDHIPPKTKLYHDDFLKCKECGKVYWQGDHFKKMQKFVNSFISKT